MPATPQTPANAASAFASARPGQLRAQRGYPAMGQTSTGQSLAATVRTQAAGLKAKPLKKPTFAAAPAQPGAAISGPPKPTGPPKPAKPKAPVSGVAKSDPFGISKRGIRADRLSLVGGKFGRIPKPPKPQARHYSGPDLGYAYPMTIGSIYGAAGASVAGHVKHRKTIKANTEQMKSNALEQSRNTRAIKRKAAGIAKAKVPLYRVTDKGTFAGRMGFHGDSMGWKDRETHLSRQAKGMYTGMAIGATVGAGSGKKKIKAQQQTLNRQNKRLTKQREILKRNMSDSEIRHRKKIQGISSRVGGTLGLTSLAAYGGSKLPGSKIAAKTPQLRRLANRVNTKKLENIALGTSTTGAGIGGAASFNFASYTSAEAKKKKPVAKSGASAFGIIHD